MENDVKELFLKGAGDDIDSKVNLINFHLDCLNNLVLQGKELFEEVTKGYTQCESCGKYSSDKSFTYTTESKLEVQTAFIDAGYGDDDEDGLFKNLYTYSVCPRCGNKKVVSKNCLGIISTWNAREGMPLRLRGLNIQD